jgi:hypothetical protein
MAITSADGYAVNVNWSDRLNVNQYNVDNANDNWRARSEDLGYEQYLIHPPTALEITTS